MIKLVEKLKLHEQRRLLLISNLRRRLDISYRIVTFSSYLNFFTIIWQSDLRSIEHDLLISDQTLYTIRFTGHFTLRSLVDNFGYPSIYDLWQWSWFSFVEKCRRCLENWGIAECQDGLFRILLKQI